MLLQRFNGFLHLNIHMMPDTLGLINVKYQGVSMPFNQRAPGTLIYLNKLGLLLTAVMQNMPQ